MSNTDKYLNSAGVIRLITKVKQLVNNTASTLVSNVSFNAASTTLTKTTGNNTADIVGAATTLRGGFMTPAMVTKLEGIASGANQITIDSALNSTSLNPVQNKVIYTALNGKVNTSRTINGYALTGNVVVRALNIPVDDQGYTSVEDWLRDLYTAKVDNTVTINGHALTDSIIITSDDIEVNGETLFDTVSLLQTMISERAQATTTINGYALTSNIQLSGADIYVSPADSTSIAKAIVALQEAIGDGSGVSSLSSRVGVLESKDYVLLSGTQTITGTKTFSSITTINGTAYLKDQANNTAIAKAYFSGENLFMAREPRLYEGMNRQAVFGSIQNAIAYIKETIKPVPVLKTLNSEELIGEGNIVLEGVHVGSETPSPHTALWVDLDAEPDDYYGIHVGEDEPTDEHVEIWIDPESPGNANVFTGSLQMSTYVTPVLGPQHLFLKANFDVEQKLQEGYELMLFRRISTSRSRRNETGHDTFKGWKHFTPWAPVLVDGQYIQWYPGELSKTSTTHAFEERFVQFTSKDVRLLNGKRAKLGQRVVGYYALGLAKPRWYQGHRRGVSPTDCIAWTEFKFIALLHNNGNTTVPHCTFLPQ